MKRSVDDQVQESNTKQSSYSQATSNGVRQLDPKLKQWVEDYNAKLKSGSIRKITEVESNPAPPQDYEPDGAEQVQKSQVRSTTTTAKKTKALKKPTTPETQQAKKAERLARGRAEYAKRKARLESPDATPEELEQAAARNARRAEQSRARWAARNVRIASEQATAKDLEVAEVAKAANARRRARYADRKARIGRGTASAKEIGQVKASNDRSREYQRKRLAAKKAGTQSSPSPSQETKQVDETQNDIGSVDAAPTEKSQLHMDGLIHKPDSQYLGSGSASQAFNQDSPFSAVRQNSAWNSVKAVAQGAAASGALLTGFLSQTLSKANPANTFGDVF